MNARLRLNRRNRLPQESRPDAQQGAAMVEFAIVLPLLLIILFGIIEFGLILFNKQVITNASREGARAGIVAQVPRRTPEYIQNVVDSYCEGHLVTFGSDKTPSVYTNADQNATFGQDLNCTVEFDYTFLVFPALLPNDWETIKLQATTIMRYE